MITDDISDYLYQASAQDKVISKIFNKIVVVKNDRPKKIHYRDSNITDKISCIGNKLTVVDIWLNFETVLANRINRLLTDNKIKKVIDLMNFLIPVYRTSLFRCSSERVFAKALDEKYSGSKRCDHHLTQLALKCAEKDARTTAELFQKIPQVILENGGKVGLACAKNDPCSTLEFIGNFEEKLVVKDWRESKWKYLDSIKNEANRQLALLNSRKDEVSVPATK